MARKTRYLQVSDVMMFEYTMLGYDDITGIQNSTEFVYVGLRDGHTLILNPVSCECEELVDSETNENYYVKKADPESLCNLNHLAVPKDKRCSEWYSFLDPDYKYVNDDNMGVVDLGVNDEKSASYAGYVSNPVDPSMEPFSAYYEDVADMRWDTARLYFVNGYDFSNIGGVLLRITVNGNDLDGKIERKIDLCDFFFTRSNAYMLVKFLTTPIMFGNNIYDRYIEVNVPCLYDLIVNKTGSDEGSLYYDVNVDPNTTMRLSFAYVLDNEMDVKSMDYTVSQLINGKGSTDLVDCSFTRSSVLNGTIPVGDISSDSLGAYIAECTDMPCFVFYATWKDQPLTKGTVWQFNKGIRLYDTSKISRGYNYDVESDYEVGTDMRKWVCMHEIKCSFCNGSIVLKSETYSMTQLFISDQDPEMFYYRPMMMDDDFLGYADNLQIVYTMRFMNVNDKVQFVKVASISMSDGLEKFYIKGTTLKPHDLTPYKIYNKIIENKHDHVGGGNGIQKTKYVKVFYSSTDVVLDDNGNVTTGSYTYTLNVSQAPKNYKFTFKRLAPNGTYTYMDMSNSYFKLMYRGADGADYFIEPTYSQNMNLYVGELEFNFNAVTVNRLQAVGDGDRKMSIVAYNEDGSVSSMFDMLYTV